MRQIVVNGTKPGEPIPLRPFKLDEGSLKAPSRFEVDFYTAGQRYSYGFSATAEAVQSEWLFLYDGNGEQPLFERVEPAEGRPAIALGQALTQDAGRRQFIAFVAEGTRPNQLFLTEAAERNVNELEAVTKWFQGGVIIKKPGQIDYQPATVRSGPKVRIAESEAFRDYLGELLKNAGTGVSRVTVKTREDGEYWGARIWVHFHHLTSAGTLVPLTPDEESDGTLHLVELAPFLFDLLQPASGAPVVHVIDELDRSLHPLLTRFFLDAFLRCSSVEHPGQILFTTHDTNLLDLTLLSRDSIWFTEKDQGGASTLYSLAEFKGEQLERLGAHIEEGYLNGRFGAIPFLGDPRRLGWAEGR
jgi:AAA15 family ATPase/GTPase